MVYRAQTEVLSRPALQGRRIRHRLSLREVRATPGPDVTAVHLGTTHIYCNRRAGRGAVPLEVMRMHEMYYQALGITDFHMVLAVRDPRTPTNTTTTKRCGSVLRRSRVARWRSPASRSSSMWAARRTTAPKIDLHHQKSVTGRSSPRRPTRLGHPRQFGLSLGLRTAPRPRSSSTGRRLARTSGSSCSDRAALARLPFWLLAPSRSSSFRSPTPSTRARRRSPTSCMPPDGRRGRRLRRPHAGQDPDPPCAGPGDHVRWPRDRGAHGIGPVA